MFKWLKSKLRKKDKDEENPVPEYLEQKNTGEPSGDVDHLIAAEMDSPEAAEEPAYYNPMLGVEAPDKTPYDRGGSVVFENVTFTYPDGSAPVLRDISLEIRSGETFSVVGPAGSGKSTLACLISRFCDASEGTVRVDGIDVKEFKKDALRERIAYVAQKNELLPGSYRDNIAADRPGADMEEIQAAARAAQAEAFILAGADGYDTDPAKAGLALTEDEKQRIAIARALLKGAEILILDGADEFLSPDADEALHAALKEHCGEITKVILSQKVTAGVMQSERIAVMDSGSIIGCGTHEELLKNCDVYRGLCGCPPQAEDAPDDTEVLDYMDPDGNVES